MVLARLISQTVNRMYLWAHSVQVPVRGVRVAIMIIYLVSCVGVPAGDWNCPTAPQAGITPACRCSIKSQRSGRCCCAKARSTGPQGGCCSAKSNSRKANSCCATKKTSRSNPNSKSTKSRLPTLTSACDCGPNEVAGLILCREPRILGSVELVIAPHMVLESSPLASQLRESGERQRPPVPPPKWRSG